MSDFWHPTALLGLVLTASRTISLPYQEGVFADRPASHGLG